MNNSGITNTYELINSARSGDQSAFESLRDLYTPLIDSQVAKHASYDMNDQDTEDLRQEALIIFCRSVLTYDIERREVEFGLYAKICIEHGLSSFLRSFHKAKRMRGISFSDIGKGDHFASGGNDMLQKVVARERLNELIGIIENSLSPFEGRVWWLYASGLTASQIAQQLKNTDSRSVSNAIYRIRKKIRAILESKENI